jgi:hypothetical protein
MAPVFKKLRRVIGETGGTLGFEFIVGGESCTEAEASQSQLPKFFVEFPYRVMPIAGGGSVHGKAASSPNAK